MQPGPCNTATVGYVNPIPVYVFSDVRQSTDLTVSSYLVLTNPTGRWAFAYFANAPALTNSWYPYIWVAPNARVQLPLSQTMPSTGQFSVVVGTYQTLLSVQVMTWRTLPDGSITDVAVSPKDVFCQ